MQKTELEKVSPFLRKKILKFSKIYNFRGFFKFKGIYRRILPWEFSIFCSYDIVLKHTRRRKKVGIQFLRYLDFKKLKKWFLTVFGHFLTEF